MIAFTGSADAGRAVISQSARQIMPVLLELGGKSPAIILPDADLSLALRSVSHFKLCKSGQSCVAGSRVLVHESIYSRVADELASLAMQVRVGLPSDPAMQMGTLISRPHRDRINDLVMQAVEAARRH